MTFGSFCNYLQKEHSILAKNYLVVLSNFFFFISYYVLFFILFYLKGESGDSRASANGTTGRGHATKRADDAGASRTEGSKRSRLEGTRRGSARYYSGSHSSRSHHSLNTARALRGRSSHERNLERGHGRNSGNLSSGLSGSPRSLGGTETGVELGNKTGSLSIRDASESESSTIILNIGGIELTKATASYVLEGSSITGNLILSLEGKSTSGLAATNLDDSLGASKSPLETRSSIIAASSGRLGLLANSGLAIGITTERHLIDSIKLAGLILRNGLTLTGTLLRGKLILRKRRSGKVGLSDGKAGVEDSSLTDTSTGNSRHGPANKITNLSLGTYNTGILEVDKRGSLSSGSIEVGLAESKLVLTGNTRSLVEIRASGLALFRDKNLPINTLGVLNNGSLPLKETTSTSGINGLRTNMHHNFIGGLLTPSTRRSLSSHVWLIY
jgi:hypothetical protein